MLSPAHRLIVKRPEGLVCMDPKPGQQIRKHLEGFAGVDAGERAAGLTSFHQQGVMCRVVGKKPDCALTVPAPQCLRLVLALRVRKLNLQHRGRAIRRGNGKDYRNVRLWVRRFKPQRPPLSQGLDANGKLVQPLVTVDSCVEPF
jgi:hypothetical protein